MDRLADEYLERYERAIAARRAREGERSRRRKVVGRMMNRLAPALGIPSGRLEKPWSR